MNIAEWSKGLQRKIQFRTVSALGSKSIISLLCAFKSTSDTCKIHGDAAMWLVQFLTLGWSAAVFSDGLCLNPSALSTANKMKPRMCRAHPDVRNNFFWTYATNVVIAENDWASPKITQILILSQTQNAGSLIAKLVKSAEVYNTWAMMRNFIRGFYECLRHSKQLYLSAHTGSKLHEVDRDATSQPVLWNKRDVYSEKASNHCGSSKTCRAIRRSSPGTNTVVKAVCSTLCR